MKIGEKLINEANTGYLPAVVYKEIKAGRKCDIIGGLCRDVNSIEDYNRLLPQMRGKFGEVIQWKPDKTAVIATRCPPKWAVDAIETALRTCPEMERWPMQ